MTPKPIPQEIIEEHPDFAKNKWINRCHSIYDRPYQKEDRENKEQCAREKYTTANINRREAESLQRITYDVNT